MSRYKSPTRTHPPSSPTSSRNPNMFPGFRPAPKKDTPIEEMSLRQLEDRRALNKKLLASPGASSSTYIHRVLLEQEAIDSRLLEIRGVEEINVGMKNTSLKGEGDMQVDPPPEPPTSRILDAKRRALSRFDAAQQERTGFSGFTAQDAMRIEQEAHRADMERRQHLEDKRRRLGIPVKGEQLTMREREARILAFMNYKPTESDLEDDSDDEDDDDPANWFEDDQDDGRKGQDIIEPDYEDFLGDIIRVDESKINYNYRHQDEGD